METSRTIVEILTFVFAVIGLLGTAWKTIQIWRTSQELSWSDFERYTKDVIRGIKQDNFLPEIILGIGRGGAFVGGVISGNLHYESKQNERNIPVLVVDRFYEWKSGRRVEVPNNMVDLSPLRGKRVLLVAGDVLGGGTMKSFLDQLEKVSPSAVKTACLVKNVTSTMNPDYVGKEIPGDFKMPWMYRGYGYVRDSRTPSGKRKRSLTTLFGLRHPIQRVFGWKDDR